MPLMNITNAAQLLFKQHPVNVRRETEGKHAANSIWLWGQGRRPQMPTLRDKFNLSGAVISAVDLIKGIGIYAALDVFGCVNVFTEGGFPTTHALFSLDKVLLTPHIAAASEEAGQDCQRRSAQAVVDVLSGRWPEHPVNPEVTPKNVVIQGTNKVI